MWTAQTILGLLFAIVVIVSLALYAREKSILGIDTSSFGSVFLRTSLNNSDRIRIDDT